MAPFPTIFETSSPVNFLSRTNLFSFDIKQHSDASLELLPVTGAFSRHTQALEGDWCGSNSLFSHALDENLKKFGAGSMLVAPGIKK